MPASVSSTYSGDYITVVMDRPPVNAQNSERVDHHLRLTGPDRDDVRVAILTGTGRMFSAGAGHEGAPRPRAPRRVLALQSSRPRMLQLDRRVRQAGDRRCERTCTRRRPCPLRRADIILCSDNAQLGMGDRCRSAPQVPRCCKLCSMLTRQAHVLYRVGACWRTSLSIAPRSGNAACCWSPARQKP